MRNTQARQLILKFLQEQEAPISAREIIDFVAKTRPDINKSTVYRFINTLSEDGLVSTIQVPGKGAVYEMRGERPHYHFNCELCDSVVCMGKDDAQIRRLVPSGYSVSQEQLVLSGVCPNCKPTSAR
jgi:Fur family ferric uptake transcriptional regulator